MNSYSLDDVTQMDLETWATVYLKKPVMIYKMHPVFVTMNMYMEFHMTTTNDS